MSLHSELEMNLPIRDTRSHNYGEYLTWPEDRRYELIDGVAYAMSPAPNRSHQQFVLHIARQISDALDGTPCEVNIAPFDVRLPDTGEADEDIQTVVQPDILVVCDQMKLDERGCRGAPDWVIEILSPSSAAHDQINKLAIYERHGVKEYWIVHPTDRIVGVYRLEGVHYGKTRDLRTKWSAGGALAGGDHRLGYGDGEYLSLLKNVLFPRAVLGYTAVGAS